jgi:hypothetical protein
MAEAIAALHGATIRIGDNTPGTRVAIRFEAAEAPAADLRQKP